ncbi:MAG: GNAT family acetyltransferase [Pseudomonadota bacterium]
MTVDIGSATPEDEAATIALWEVCGLVTPHNPPAEDFRRALNNAASNVLIARNSEVVIGTAMVGDDGHRGWIYYLAVAPAYQGTGVGQILCSACENWARGRGVRKIQLMMRPANKTVASFYAASGYEVTPRLVMAKWLDKTAAGELG